MMLLAREVVGAFDSEVRLCVLLHKIRQEGVRSSAFVRIRSHQ